jgi:hypothetical protein
MGKAGGMVFWKAIRAKALDLFEHLLSQIQIITARHHAADQPVVASPTPAVCLKVAIARRSLSAFRR